MLVGDIDARLPVAGQTCDLQGLLGILSVAWPGTFTKVKGELVSADLCADEGVRVVRAVRQEEAGARRAHAPDKPWRPPGSGGLRGCDTVEAMVADYDVPFCTRALGYNSRRGS